MNETTLYKKIGRRYVKHDDFLDPKGLPQGLYLFYKPNYLGEHSAMMSMLHYAKVHDVQEVGKFCDLIVGHEKKLDEAIRTFLENRKEVGFSVNDLTLEILAIITKL